MPRGQPAPDNVTAFPSIHLVFKAITGRELGNLPNGEVSEVTANGDIRDFCFAHEDANNPSCNYNVNTGIWKCFTCDEGGGIRELLVASHQIPSGSGWTKWLKSHGLLTENAPHTVWENVSHTYDYVNEQGAMVYQVGRWNLPNGKKDFRQRAPKPSGGWTYTLKGIARVPYNLPKVIETAQAGGTIYVVEGEKDADRLNGLGLCATTNAQGSKFKWPSDWSKYFAGAKTVIVIPDNDETGIHAASERAAICAISVEDTRVLAPLPDVGDHGDISDWLDLGRNIAELAELPYTAAVPHVRDYPEAFVPRLIERMTDTGNGEWFALCTHDKVIWLSDQETWMFFDGKRWTEDGQIEQITTEVVNKLRAAANDYDGPERDDFIEHAKQTESAAKRRGMQDIAKGFIFSSSSQFDKHKSLLNLQNGVLDLLSLELMPHAPEQKMTKISSVAYDPDADCPNFRKWLYEAMCGDQEMVDYVQQIMGSTLEGRYGIRRMFFAHGPGGTGKSTITHVMSTLLGDYATTLDFASVSQRQFASGSAPSPDIAKLRGARLIAAVESRYGDRLDTAKLKSFMGGDEITARNLNQGTIKFRIEGTMFFSGNELPNVADGDQAFWDKLKTIPFTHKIEKQDLNFFDNVIRPELAGILNFALEGFQKCYLNGRHLPEPQKITDATNAYREEQDPIAEFLGEWCERTEDGLNKKFHTSSTDLFKAYRVYCDETSQSGIRSPNRFGACLKHAGLERKPHRKEDGRVVHEYEKIRLKQEVIRKVKRANDRYIRNEETEF
jgi:P4 family phage/plasmid primase-like protien